MRGSRARIRHAPAEPGLRDVQHALAREHGAESWTALKDRLARSRSRHGEVPLGLLLEAADRGDLTR